jgi:hypothetical protein
MTSRGITLFDRIKPFSIPDNEILGAAVPVTLLIELQAQIDELRAERAGFTLLVQHAWKLTAELTAVCAELTNEAAHRQFLLESHRRAEREAERLRLPLWFWRPEAGRDVESLLTIRAAFLAKERKVQLDDTWDLLQEFSRDWLKIEPDDGLLRRIMAEAYGESEGA